MKTSHRRLLKLLDSLPQLALPSHPHVWLETASGRSVLVGVSNHLRIGCVLSPSKSEALPPALTFERVRDQQSA
jgi:hypothetical protein